jgi:hypothetical protein
MVAGMRRGQMATTSTAEGAGASRACGRTTQSSFGSVQAAGNAPADDPDQVRLWASSSALPAWGGVFV